MSVKYLPGFAVAERGVQQIAAGAGIYSMVSVSPPLFHP